MREFTPKVRPWYVWDKLHEVIELVPSSLFLLSKEDNKMYIARIIIGSIMILILSIMTIKYFYYLIKDFIERVRGGDI